MRIVIVW